MAKDKREVVLEAVEFVKNCEYKATGIKVELEAQLDRGSDGDDECSDCDGDGDWTCNDCDGDNEWDCNDCHGFGHIHERTTDHGDIITEGCTEEVEGAIECVTCQGEGTVYCSHCESGRVECENCGGSGNFGNGEEGNWSSELFCQDYILEKLVDIGLAERNDTTARANLRGHYGNFRPKLPMVYCQFYNDHSVDSEFTFTLSLDDNENIFLLPHVLEAFQALGEAVGNGINVSGAGMHTALLNDPECNYGGTQSINYNLARYRNFSRSIQLLLPALFFLASPDETSRGLSYREPRTGCDEEDGNKYSAVFYVHGAIEFRVFQTCYDNPEAILDFFVVIRNCMNYWTEVFKPSGINKITKQMTFGNDRSMELKRLFCTAQHIDVLNAGLQKLRPSYYTITEIKKQRKFKVTKKEVNGLLDRVRKTAKKDYVEYRERYSFMMEAKRGEYLTNFMYDYIDKHNGHLAQQDRSKALEEVQKLVTERLEKEIKRIQIEDDYVESRVKVANDINRGMYTLQEN